jgi:O-antigen/teichoic acid export membrane protein
MDSLKRIFIHKFQLFKKLKKDNNYFVKGTAWVTFNQIITIFFGVLLSVIFARYTTKELFGEYNFLISIISILSIVAIPGLNTSMLRSISRGKDGVYLKAVRISFIWSLLGIPILLLVGGYYYYFSNKIIGLLLFASAFFFPLIYAPNNWASLLKGKKKFDTFSKYSLIEIMIRSLTIILAIILGKGNIIPIFMAYLVTTGLSNIIFYTKCKTYLNNNYEDDGWEKSGYKLSINEFLTLSYNYLDKIFIGIFLGPVELAIYTIAVTIVSAINGSVLQIMKVTYPYIFSINKEKLKSNLRKAIIPGIMLSIIFLIVILISIPPVIILLYSDKYIGSIIYAQIYSVTIFLSLVNSILITSLIALNEENAIIKFNLLGLILVIVLYYVLIPFLGILGAILSSIIYYSVLVVLEFIYFKSR